MKYFCCAIIIIIIILSLIILNLLFMNKLSVDILEDISVIKELDLCEAGDKVDEVWNYWTRVRGYAQVAATYNQIDRVDDHIIMLRSAQASHDGEEFRKALALLEGSVKELARLERLSLSNIM
jgi:hypothetical protein